MSETRLGIIDFPYLLQTLAAQGRDGVLTITSPETTGHQWRLVFRNGQVAASRANDPYRLYHALRWIGLMTPERYVEAGVPDDQALEDLKLAQSLLGHHLLVEDGIRDAIDSLIEERVTMILGIENPGLAFDEAADTLDEWETYQIGLGTSIAPNGLLMEGLRLQDEYSRFGGLHFNDDDMLIKTGGESRFPEDSAEHALLAMWRDRDPIWTNLLGSGLPPSTANLALLACLNQQALRKSSVAELVILADQLQQANMDREREQVLRQAVKQGASNPRILLQLAYLSEQRRDYRQAAQDNLAGGQALVHQNPRIALKAFNKAREFGANRMLCLEGMLACHKSLQDIDSACTILLQLADQHEKQADIDQAIHTVREAQEMGADPIACALSLGKLLIANDDIDSAVMQLQSAAHLALQDNRTDAAVMAWERILELQPNHAEIALLLAQHHTAHRNQALALVVIQRALGSCDEEHYVEQVTGLRELLARLDPDDAENHRVLARIYQKRKDVDNAAGQLLQLAQSQESQEDWRNLASTLGRILEIDHQRLDVQVKLAEVLARIGFTERSAQIWNQAVHNALATGKLDEAKRQCQEALKTHPSNAELHAQIAQIAFREANQRLASQHYQHAAHLAIGSGDHQMAVIMLNQLCHLRPDDLLVRQLLAHQNVLTRGEGSDENLRQLIRLAIRSHNIGIAIEHAYQRVLTQSPPAFAARNELVELLRRGGRTREELDEGMSLFQDLLEAGEFRRALDLQQRIVASHSKDPLQVQNLGEVFEALSQNRQAVRCYRLAASLFQQEGNDSETADMLQRLLILTDHSPDITRALELAEQGAAINWEAIRAELAQANKKKIIDKVHEHSTSYQASGHRHEGTATYQPHAQ